MSRSQTIGRSHWCQRHIIVFITGVVALAGHGTASAIDLFVDPSGIDSTNCTDQANPCATIAHVLSQTTPGDKVYLAPFNTSSSGLIAGIPTLPGGAHHKPGAVCPLASPTVYTEHNLFSLYDIELIGGGRNCTVVDAQGADRILTMQNGGSVSHITFANGSAPASSTGYGNGGAIMAWSGTLTIADSRFENNSAVHGGAVSTDASVEKLIIRRTVFEGNTASSGGGAVHCSLCPELIVAHTHFVGNSAVWLGGALYFGTGDDNPEPDGLPEEITIRYSRFIDNASDYIGGAISIDSTEGHDTYVKDTLFEKNVAKDNKGGALFSYKGRLTIDGSTFDTNQADASRGGAVYYSGDGDYFSAYNSTFTRNSAARGGAVYLDTETRGYLASNTLLGNHASDVGYGDHLSGIWSYLNIYQTIIMDDPSGVAGDTACYPSATTGTGGRNLIADGTCGSWIGFNQGVANGVDANLSSGNGPTKVHELLPGSNAIDAGGTFALQCIEFATPSYLITDQQENSRFEDGDGNGSRECDIGSVEKQSP